MPLPQLLRPTLELNIGLEILLKIGLPLTGQPNMVELLQLQVLSRVVLRHMVHLVVKILMGLVLLGLVDLHHIQQEMALQFRWLQSEVLPQLLLILF
jgi:hypothetical protein